MVGLYKRRWHVYYNGLPSDELTHLRAFRSITKVRPSLQEPAVNPSKTDHCHQPAHTMRSSSKPSSSSLMRSLQSPSMSSRFTNDVQTPIRSASPSFTSGTRQSAVYPVSTDLPFAVNRSNPGTSTNLQMYGSTSLANSRRNVEEGSTSVYKSSIKDGAAMRSSSSRPPVDLSSSSSRRSAVKFLKIADDGCLTRSVDAVNSRSSDTTPERNRFITAADKNRFDSTTTTIANPKSSATGQLRSSSSTFPHKSNSSSVFAANGELIFERTRSRNSTGPEVRQRSSSSTPGTLSSSTADIMKELGKFDNSSKVSRSDFARPYSALDFSRQTSNLDNASDNLRRSFAFDDRKRADQFNALRSSLDLSSKATDKDATEERLQRNYDSINSEIQRPNLKQYGTGKNRSESQWKQEASLYSYSPAIADQYDTSKYLRYSKTFDREKNDADSQALHPTSHLLNASRYLTDGLGLGSDAGTTGQRMSAYAQQGAIENWLTGLSTDTANKADYSTRRDGSEDPSKTRIITDTEDKLSGKYHSSKLNGHHYNVDRKSFPPTESDSVSRYNNSWQRDIDARVSQDRTMPSNDAYSRGNILSGYNNSSSSSNNNKKSNGDVAISKRSSHQTELQQQLMVTPNLRSDLFSVVDAYDATDISNSRLNLLRKCLDEAEVVGKKSSSSAVDDDYLQLPVDGKVQRSSIKRTVGEELYRPVSEHSQRSSIDKKKEWKPPTESVYDDPSPSAKFLGLRNTGSPNTTALGFRSSSPNRTRSNSYQGYDVDPVGVEYISREAAPTNNRSRTWTQEKEFDSEFMRSMKESYKLTEDSGENKNVDSELFQRHAVPDQKTSDKTYSSWRTRVNGWEIPTSAGRDSSTADTNRSDLSKYKTRSKIYSNDLIDTRRHDKMKPETYKTPMTFKSTSLADLREAASLVELREKNKASSRKEFDVRQVTFKDKPFDSSTPTTSSMAQTLSTSAFPETLRFRDETLRKRTDSELTSYVDKSSSKRVWYSEEDLKLSPINGVDADDVSRQFDYNPETFRYAFKKEPLSSGKDRFEISSGQTGVTKRWRSEISLGGSPFENETPEWKIYKENRFREDPPDKTQERRLKVTWHDEMQDGQQNNYSSGTTFLSQNTKFQPPPSPPASTTSHLEEPGGTSHSFRSESLSWKSFFTTSSLNKHSSSSNADGRGGSKRTETTKIDEVHQPSAFRRLQDSPFNHRPPPHPNSGLITQPPPNSNPSLPNSNHDTKIPVSRQRHIPRGSSTYDYQRYLATDSKDTDNFPHNTSRSPSPYSPFEHQRHLSNDVSNSQLGMTAIVDRPTSASRTSSNQVPYSSSYEPQRHLPTHDATKSSFPESLHLTSVSPSYSDRPLEVSADSIMLRRLGQNSDDVERSRRLSDIYDDVTDADEKRHLSSKFLTSAMYKEDDYEKPRDVVYPASKLRNDVYSVKNISSANDPLHVQSNYSSFDKYKSILTPSSLHDARQMTSYSAPAVTTIPNDDINDYSSFRSRTSNPSSSDLGFSNASRSRDRLGGHLSIDICNRRYSSGSLTERLADDTASVASDSEFVVMRSGEIVKRPKQK